jgi:lantibiotic modifying enzyme
MESVTSKPSVNRWRPSGFAMGGAGLAIMCTAFDDRFPDDGWDVLGHELLAAGLDEVSGPDTTLSLFTGAVGYAAAIWHASHEGQRYQRLLAAMDSALLSGMLKRARDLATGRDASPDSYDIVAGISGWVGYLRSRAGSAPVDEVAHVVADALVALLSEVGVPRIGYRRTWTSPSGRHHEGIAVDCGLAHGLAGPLAALSVLETQFQLGRTDVVTSIRWAARRLIDQAVDTDGCLLWPTAIGLVVDEPVQLGGADINGGSWCHGGSGIARALYLAGVAIDDSAYREFAVHAMRTHCERQPVLPSPNLCHGLAGQLMVASVFAHDTNEPLIARSVQRLTDSLLGRFRADSPLGYVDVERPGLMVDHPGLLRGAAGVALALLAVSAQEIPRWSQLFLLS